MAKLKEFRIDAFSYPMNSSHLIINGKGDVKTFSGMNVKISKIKKLQSFLQALDSALILDFKALGKYKGAENHYHISVIYEDDTEESHYYVDNLVKNSQNSLRDVLIKYIDKDYLIDAVLEDK